MSKEAKWAWPSRAGCILPEPEGYRLFLCVSLDLRVEFSPDAPMQTLSHRSENPAWQESPPSVGLRGERPWRQSATGSAGKGKEFMASAALSNLKLALACKSSLPTLTGSLLSQALDTCNCFIPQKGSVRLVLLSVLLLLMKELRD